jgi:hypothetical protein
MSGEMERIYAPSLHDAILNYFTGSTNISEVMSDNSTLG